MSTEIQIKRTSDDVLLRIPTRPREAGGVELEQAVEVELTVPIALLKELAEGTKLGKIVGGVLGVTLGGNAVEVAVAAIPYSWETVEIGDLGGLELAILEGNVEETHGDEG